MTAGKLVVFRVEGERKNKLRAQCTLCPWSRVTQLGRSLMAQERSKAWISSKAMLHLNKEHPLPDESADSDKVTPEQDAYLRGIQEGYRQAQAVWEPAMLDLQRNLDGA